MKNRPYYDATLAACNSFLSNFNFLFINVFLGSIYLFINDNGEGLENDNGERQW